MAFVSNMDNDEQKNPAQGAVPPSGGAGVQLAPSGGVGSTGASPQPGQPGAGGQFATLDKYLNANQGQAEPLANKITQGIGQQYNALDTQNNATISGINKQVQNAPGYTASNPDVLAQEAANPVAFAGDQGNIKQFQGLLNNSYGGPLTAESTADYTKQQNAVNNAISQGKQQTTTEAGRKQLLEQNEAAPSTSVTGLNSAILSQDPNAQAKVENAYKPFSNLLTNLQTGAQNVNATIGQEQADATKSSSAANKQIADQVNALNTNVNNTVTQAEAARQKYNTDLQKYQTQYNPISTNINSLNELFKGAPVQTNFGGNYGQITNPFTSTLGQTVNNNVANANNVATEDQYNQAAAFQKLLNGLNLGIPTPTLNQSTINLAGTYVPQPTLNAPQGDVAAQQIADSFNKAIDPNGPGPSSMNPDQAAFTNRYMPTYQNLLAQLRQLNPNLQGQ